MNSTEQKTIGKRAFTIIELLTVMSVIVLLIGLMVPALRSFRIYAKKVKQKAQFHSIEVVLDLFNAENEDYPPSYPTDKADGTGQPYCGAMKLCEALMGQDLMGFHPGSDFSLTAVNQQLYKDSATFGHTRITMGPSLQFGNANPHSLVDIYGTGTGSTGVFSRTDPNYVLCDVYTTGASPGKPILYYKADKSNYPNNPFSIADNYEIVKINQPASIGLWTNLVFYGLIRNKNVTAIANWPHRAESYILQSAGYDGIFGPIDKDGNGLINANEMGSCDDVFNFERDY